MSLPMRITFENQDYTYSVLTKVINKNTTEIKINLQGEDQTLIRTLKGEWECLGQTIGENQSLIKAIGKNIALRHRL